MLYGLTFITNKRYYYKVKRSHLLSPFSGSSLVFNCRISPGCSSLHGRIRIGSIYIEHFYIRQHLNFSGQCECAHCLIHLPIPVSLLPVCFGSPYAYASFYCWALSLCLKLSANLHLSSHLQVQAHRSMSVFLRLCFT